MGGPESMYEEAEEKEEKEENEEKEEEESGGAGWWERGVVSWVARRTLEECGKDAIAMRLEACISN